MLTEKLLQIALIGAEWVLYLLLVLSVISVGIVIERIRFFRAGSRNASRIIADFSSLLASNDMAKAAELAGNPHSIEAAVLSAGLAQVNRGAQAAEEAMAAALVAQRLTYERRLAFLGTVGNNAPFIGLFGTVLGIIRAFHDLSLDQSKGAAAVMAGISEALVATAVGLFVAIPAVVAYNYFQREVKSAATNAERLSHILLSHIKGTNDKHDGSNHTP